MTNTATRTPRETKITVVHVFLLICSCSLGDDLPAKTLIAFSEMNRRCYNPPPHTNLCNGRQNTTCYILL